ncbi:hypothetical protein H261_15290 [Paramagnetospirillum caucaseum]|uniref:YtxH domain-containing protein n=1 Tax=Paramagnetospirillum caucaseum TaxID=1244869 RepID=M2ZP00_9PROT|nr:YtxH domain-containing protein [Paramagnetospirillum caucaseum]EME69037.1 hypothetical protein H261_15290 [Paramagnetospirillum caucaseum]
MAKKKRKKAKNGKRNGDWNGAPAQGNGQGQGLFGGLANLLPGKTSEQFLVGALIGAAATYVLADEALRARLIRSGLKLYSELAGGLAEIKEQAADIQAELAAGQS